MAKKLPPRQHCRCRHCGARQVKRMPLDWYVRPPRCRQCHRKGTLRPDAWMNNRNTSATACTCDGYSAPRFPHRRGSRFCLFRADGTRRQPGDADFVDQFQEWERDQGRAPDEEVPF